MAEPVHSLAYATIVGYHRAIAAVHVGFHEGLTVSNHLVLHSLMRGTFNSKASAWELRPVGVLPRYHLVKWMVASGSFHP